MTLSNHAEPRHVNRMNAFHAASAGQNVPDPKEKEQKKESNKDQKPDITKTKPQIPKWY
ncbi:MAG TPA: hypothetical protein PLE74_04010 [Candidatus Cloacimonadota bacterium]|nr:hypothetical protein [Candidatus Cloacimonadota bacterium]HPT71425.1 hypothetical protein [Candidatus Cloacimonadota bacterium]